MLFCRASDEEILQIVHKELCVISSDLAAACELSGCTWVSSGCQVTLLAFVHFVGGTLQGSRILTM